jgi:predicted tellurium resistance membrane protein TerC
MEFLLEPSIWIAFLTLTVLEIILGIDNLILITILAERLPPNQQPLARKVGLGVALVTRLILLSLAFWVAQLETILFSVFAVEFSWRSILLILGGVFLLAKGTLEIHHKIEGDARAEQARRGAAFATVIIQIALMDIVFSFDSVMTAIGIADHLSIMIAALSISMLIMVLAVDRVSDFIARHPTVKVLALSYMLLIGLALIGEGLGTHIPKGYLYFAMAFSFFVEMVNMRIRRLESAKNR